MMVPGTSAYYTFYTTQYSIYIQPITVTHVK